ncbi:FAD-dependent monooxygenase [Nocardia iowensis]|uniref:FAD-dependent monooxygenase n=1 Tax=Nocardia iowensis TaxID=204891 RepID=A0ABX8RMF6_NOCIO|nr:FAD-dependent monooxygenase [Nocardia iowensis]QXN90107.1 FAD-dependent monooxygenase [Nocardia iowensis]
MSNSLSVLVVGAGVAGIAAATALDRRGLSVDIVERRTQSPAGAGLFLPGNAVRALTELGLGAALDADAAPIRRQRLLDQRGRKLADIDMADLWQGVGQAVGITHDRLRSALVDNLGLSIQSGVTVRALTESESGVEVSFSDGSSGHYDVVVGADGVHSELRHIVNPDAEVRYAGQICWRFVTGNTAGIDSWTVWLGRGTTFLAVPVGKDRLYCYADLSRSEPAAAGTPLPNHFSHFDHQVRDLLAAPEAAEAYISVIEEVTDPTWRTHRVILIGDAAHASSPNMAQGVAMSVEDALMLAETLCGSGEVEQRLEQYRRRRLPRTQWVQARARRRDSTRGMAPAIRNMVLRLAASRIYARDYGLLRAQP